MFFFFFVSLGALNLTVFVKFYCIQIRKLKLEKGFVVVHNDYLEQWYIALGTYGKSVILLKRALSSSFSCEPYFHLLLSLTSIILLYLVVYLFSSYL